MISHLRRNVVAYLALLFVACTGTAYAAGLANGSVTTKKLAKNAVTAPKIKANAVRSADIKNGSVGAADLAIGVLPDEVTVFANGATGSTPAASPDLPNQETQEVTLDAASSVVVRFTYDSAYMTCSAGTGYAALRLDETPIPGSAKAMAPSASAAQALTLGVTVQVPAGTHVLTVDRDCPSGNFTTSNTNNPSWLVLATAN